MPLSIPNKMTYYLPTFIDMYVCVFFKKNSSIWKSTLHSVSIIFFQIRDVVDPAEMVQNCISWCNTNNTENSELAACGFFNFESGKSRTRLSSAQSRESHRWQESKCHYAVVGVAPKPGSSEVQLVQDDSFDHFSQLCLRKGTRHCTKLKKGIICSLSDPHEFLTRSPQISGQNT